MERQRSAEPKVQNSLPKFSNLAGGTRQLKEDGVDEGVAERMLVERVLAEQSLINEPGDREVDTYRKLNRAKGRGS